MKNEEFIVRMKPKRATSLLLAAAVAALAYPAAAKAGDAATGAQLARQWCAGCHTVGATEQARADMPPSFASIARTTTKSDDELRAWLSTPHANMPPLDLSRAAIDDLISYLRSLAPRKP